MTAHSYCFQQIVQTLRLHDQCFGDEFDKHFNVGQRIEMQTDGFG